MDRRSFLGLLAATPICFISETASASPGISAAPDLFAAFTSLRGVYEGAGRGTMHVLFAPWCSVTPELYRDTRSVLGRMRIKWMPFSGGQPEGRYGTEYLLRSGDPADLPRSFTRIRSVMPISNTPMSDAQDAALSTALPLYYRDAGGSLSTPTILYKMAGDRIRLVRGAPSRSHIEEIAALAT